MAGYSYQECDACGYQAGGYAPRELEKQGWVWHVKDGTTFVMCDECTDEYERRREVKRALETAQR